MHTLQNLYDSHLGHDAGNTSWKLRQVGQAGHSLVRCFRFARRSMHGLALAISFCGVAVTIERLTSSQKKRISGYSGKTCLEVWLQPACFQTSRFGVAVLTWVTSSCCTVWPIGDYSFMELFLTPCVCRSVSLQNRVNRWYIHLYRCVLLRI